MFLRNDKKQIDKSKKNEKIYSANTSYPQLY